MREIVSRGKKKTNEWIEGSLVVSSGSLNVGRCYILSEFSNICHGYEYELGDKIGNFYEVDPETTGQFAGLCDKNGNRIFEGDICRFQEWQHGEFCWVGVVKFENCQFLITGGPNEECETPFTLCLSRFSSEQIEVIGNIYDNSELLQDMKQNDIKGRKMTDWSLQTEEQQREYRALQTRRRDHRKVENSFYQIPQSPHRSYNQDGRAVYVPDVSTDMREDEKADG